MLLDERVVVMRGLARPMGRVSEWCITLRDCDVSGFCDVFILLPIVWCMIFMTFTPHTAVRFGQVVDPR